MTDANSAGTSEPVPAIDHARTAETVLDTTLPDVSLGERGLRLRLSGGEAYFNYYWLRDACPTAMDPETRERTFDLVALQAPPRPGEARIEGGTLAIDWANEAHVSRIPLATLERFAAGGAAPDPAAIARKPWGADAAFLRVAQTSVERDDNALARLACALIEDGIAIVTGMEDSDESLTRLVHRLGPVVPSAEGGYFDVRLSIAPTNLAFTAKALEPHTDLPSEEHAPGVQFLHCRRNSVEGGRSLFIDGVAVAEALRGEDPAAFALLATHDVPFSYRHDGHDFRAHQRVIELDHRGAVEGVTVSQHLQDPMDLPQALLDDFYPALARFLSMLREDRFTCRFRLNAGECVVFDNHRVVHGREAFVAESGERHLRGCYTDRGAVRSTYRVLSDAAGGRSA